jgi:hypothetical protein
VLHFWCSVNGFVTLPAAEKVLQFWCGVSDFVTLPVGRAGRGGAATPPVLPVVLALRAVSVVGVLGGRRNCSRVPPVSDAWSRCSVNLKGLMLGSYSDFI